MARIAAKKTNPNRENAAHNARPLKFKQRPKGLKRIKARVGDIWQKAPPLIKKFLQRHKILRGFVYLIVCLVVLMTILAIVFRPADTQITKVGSSFSVKYAHELGIDWQAAYTALLDDIGIRYLRLMSHWDDHEKVNNEYDFSELDWQMDEAAKRGAQVSLSIGLRQPRWPECHYPDWARRMPQEQWRPELMEYIETVVTRYKDHLALNSYQLENEALNHWFGECYVHEREILKTHLQEEYDLVKSLDTNTPVYMSLSDQHGIPLDKPVPDRFGYSVYRIVYNTQLAKGYFIYPTPIWYHRMRAWIINQLHNRGDIFVHELQLEPWGPAPTPQLSIPEQDKSMSPTQMYKNVDFARQIGFDEAYLWGAEWWYWRKNYLDDDGPWIAAKDIVRQINSGIDFTVPKDIKFFPAR